MVDLVFFSSNRTKLNHFRYMARSAGVRVKSFRELNYYASYDEPRIDDRAELLRQSYKSALTKWSKRLRNVGGDTSTFFFEDTSVKIHALSKIHEFPGVNVKFWMKQTTFASLDKILRENGNDRRATVRSDIVMHLPSRWREILGTTDEFLWVSGDVEGTIISEERPTQLNLVYPWLDDKSFNRWFVPNGAETSLSALAIADADRYDFRNRAFKKIVQVLAQLNLLDDVEKSDQIQLEIPTVEIVPSILIVCGPSCAGKTSIARWYNKNYLLPHIEASDFMYRAFWERHGLGSTTKIGNFAEEALKTQPDIVAAQVAAHILKKGFASAIVTGFRAPEEIDFFVDALKNLYRCEVIFLEASYESRLQRAILRNRDSVTVDKFNARDEQESRMGLYAISALSATKKIKNESTVSALVRRFSSRYRSFFMSGKNHYSRSGNDSNLEPFIILTLANTFRSGKWLTTTEIATALNAKFGLNKFKDNISRYFNQGFHPYYEVRLRMTTTGESRTVEYRLSTTGLGEAQLLNAFPPSMTYIRTAATFEQFNLF